MNLNDYVLLGKATKAKHPEYRNYTDEEVGRIIAKKNPQYAGKPVLLDPRLTETATKQREAVAEQSLLQSAVTGLKYTKEAQQVDHEANVEAKRASTKLTVTAAAKGMDTMTFSQASYQAALADLKLREIAVQASVNTQSEIEKARELAKIKLEEDVIRNQMTLDMEATRDERELQKDQIKWRMEVEAAQRVRAASQHHLLDLQDRLFEQAAKVRALPVGTLEHEIAEITFDSLKAEMYALTGKNVPASNGPGIKDAPKGSDTRTDDE